MCCEHREQALDNTEMFFSAVLIIWWSLQGILNVVEFIRTSKNFYKAKRSKVFDDQATPGNKEIPDKT